MAEALRGSLVLNALSFRVKRTVFIIHDAASSSVKAPIHVEIFCDTHITIRVLRYLTRLMKHAFDFFSKLPTVWKL